MPRRQGALPPAQLRGQLTAHGYVVSPASADVPEPAPFAGGFTVQTYGSSHRDGIDALQVEIAAPVRTDDLARAAFVEQLARALAVLVADRACAVPAPAGLY